MELKACYACIVFFLVSISLSGQNLVASTGNASLSMENSETPTPDWAFYEDEDNQKLLIDFSALDSHLTDLVIVNDQNEEIFREDLYELPGNSIYELDLATFQKGNYSLNISTFNQPITRSISIN